MMQQDMSVFFDAAGKELLMVNHTTREITNTDPAAAGGEASPSPSARWP